MSPDLRVAFPFVGVQVGGATVSTGEMVRRLRADGRVEPVVFAPHEGPSALVFRNAGVEPVFFAARDGRRHVLVASTRTWTGKLRALPVYAALQRLARDLLRDERIDVVHLNEDRLVLPWGIAARRCGLPVVWHVRQERPNRWLDRLRLRLADQLIFVADANRSRFRGHRRFPPTVTQPNAVDLQRFVPCRDRLAAKRSFGLDPQRLTLTFVGNLVERKRPTWVLRAAGALQSRMPLQVVLAGAPLGPPAFLVELEDLVRRAPEPAHVHLLGPRSDIPDLLAASDVLTLPSVLRGEAFPRVVIEAMAAGVPVVATRVAGVAEAVDDGVTGVLVDPEDFAGYQRSLASVLADASVRQTMGHAAAEVARQRYGGERLADELVRIYQGLAR